MENTLTYNNPPYECDMTYSTNQKVLEKYQTQLEECDLKESLDVFKKLSETLGEGPAGIQLMLHKESGKEYNSPLYTYLSSKNLKTIIPIIPLIIFTDDLTQSEQDQGYQIVSRLGDGVVGLCFDKPLESDLEITFYVRNSEWKETLVVPKGTVIYKLPRFICNFWLQFLPLLVKGMIPGATLLGTYISQDDRDFHTPESDRVRSLPRHVVCGCGHTQPIESGKDSTCNDDCF